MKRKTNCKILFSCKKCGFKEAVDSFCQQKRLAGNETLSTLELHFEEKYLQQGEKYYSGRPTVYPQNLLSNPSPLPTQQTTSSLPRRRSFPDELSTFQQRDVIRIFQDLNEPIAPAGFPFK